MRFTRRVPIFEIARVYLPQADQELPDEPRRLGIVMTGPRRQVSRSAAADETLDFYDLKGAVETLLGRLHVTDISFAPTEHSSFQSGRAARLVVGDREIGVMGEIHPLVRESFDLGTQRVCLL